MIITAKAERVGNSTGVRITWDDWSKDLHTPMLVQEARRLAASLHSAANAADVANRPGVKPFWK